MVDNYRFTLFNCCKVLICNEKSFFNENSLSLLKGVGVLISVSKESMADVSKIQAPCNGG